MFNHWTAWKALSLLFKSKDCDFGSIFPAPSTTLPPVSKQHLVGGREKRREGGNEKGARRGQRE